MPSLRTALDSVSIPLSNGHIAQTIYVQQKTEIPVALEKIGLPQACPVLVLIGGASRLGQPDLRIQRLFGEILAPLAEELGAIVVDGGTDAGVMKLMGQARSSLAATFPLVGVSPLKLINLPDKLPAVQAFPPEPNHTHFILVPGAKWGDESKWIAWTASAIARNKPSITVLVNGGEISLIDIQCSKAEARPIAVVAGSGRLADKIADALLVPGSGIADAAITSLLQSGQIHPLPLSHSTCEIAGFLRQQLSEMC